MPRFCLFLLFLLEYSLPANLLGLFLTPCFPLHSGFSYVDLVEGLHDGRFYALKRIICHDKDDRQEAMHEVEMHLLFEHPNILPLCAHSIAERGSKHEAWLLLPFLKVNVWEASSTVPELPESRCKVAMGTTVHAGICSQGNVTCLAGECKILWHQSQRWCWSI